MSLINWVQYTEPVVGAGAPGLADVTNRPLQEILAASGFTNPLADFPGFILALDPIFNSDVTINGNLDVIDNITIGGNIIIDGSVTFSGNVAFPADVNVVGHFSVNTNKFNVDPANGNTLVAGTLGIIGSVSINTSKFTIDAATGNTIIAGTAGITGAVTGGTYNAQTISSTTSFTGTVAVASDFSINTSKFTVIGSSGNTIVAGTLGVTGSITSGLINSQTISSTANFTGTLNSTGNFSVGTTLFTVAAASGNTIVGGSLTFSTAITKIVPGATSFNVYNNAGTIVNLNIPDAGGMNLALPSSGQANFNFSGGEVGQFFVQVPNGTMPQSLQLRNASTTAGHRSLSLFTSDGSTGTVGAYYFTGSNVRTAWEYANITGNNPIVLRIAPEGGETRFGDNFSNASIVSRVRMYGTSTSNNGNVAQTLVIQQGGIATDTLLLSGDLTAGARLVFTPAVSKIIPGATSISIRNNADSVDNLIITNAGNITITGTTISTGLITGNAGITIASGQTLTLTGTTVSGTPTWSSNQAITLSTAAQGNITSVGTLTSITTSGSLTFTSSAVTIVPGATSLAIRNNANSASNLFITDAGLITFRNNVTLSTGGFLSNVSANDKWDNTGTRVIVQGYSASGSAGARYVFQSSRGTIATPTASQNGDILSFVQSEGHNGTSFIIGVELHAITTQVWSSGSNGCAFVIQTTPNGSATTVTALTLDQDQSATFANTIKTAAPSGGTAGAWKLGVLVTAAVTVDLTKYIQLDVGGTLYKLITST